MSNGLFLAVDGGATKTDVVLGTAAGAVLASVRGPASSPHYVGVPGCVAIVDALVAEARAAAALAPEAVVDRAEVYLAGADLPVEVDVLHKAVGEAGWAREHRVDNDTFALLRAGTDARDAVAVVCGTGINCLGRDAAGRTARFPSLGQISGDWGGGEQLATLALYRAARGEDGRDAPTALSTAVAAHFGRSTVEEVSAGLHLGEIPTERISELSPVLFAVAAAGDPTARRVVARQADEIVTLVRVAATRLDLRGVRYAVVLGGGVLAARHPLLMDAVEAGIAAHSPHATPTLVTAPPVVGAGLLALDAFGAPPPAVHALRAALTAP
ncbi:BadF/BadG/BcrA/BcrD ATPase family protein [Phytohabitans flavus]|uniref:Kinase n=1 Tax=Phytohabitans flavus TaxID=1076124 RepID=A0A6F8XT86_9ACTN|nr:BadF/BadG/BcrA/BcrD ATPase family protein [Phytohabitans flavus]BCB77062.1 kinase [Phytohabitans flavus]